MPVAITEKRVSRKITVNLDHHQINVRPIIKGNFYIVLLLKIYIDSFCLKVPLKKLLIL